MIGQEGDKENPHRRPGPGKEILLEVGGRVEAQTRRGPGMPLTFDPEVRGALSLSPSLPPSLSLSHTHAHTWTLK